MIHILSRPLNGNPIGQCESEKPELGNLVATESKKKTLLTAKLAGADH